MEIERPTPPPFAWAEPFVSVGITGTNGKTSTTRLVASIFRAAGLGAVEIGTVEYAVNGVPTGVPHSLGGFYETLRQGAEQGVQRAAIECTSKALSEGYAKRWRFDVGVFTNLSEDHLQTHGSWEHYLASKAQLFVHLGPGALAVLNAADPHALLVDHVTPPDVGRAWFASISRGPSLRQADLAATGIEVDLDGTRCELAPSRWAEALGGRIEIPFVGEVFVENALAAALVGLRTGIEADAVRAGLAAATPVPGRFEVVHRRPAVVVDYAHTPDAMTRTCATARGLAPARLIVVFGAGGNSSPSKRGPLGEVVGRSADVAVVTSDNPRDEDPAEIAAAVVEGCQRGGRARVHVELDRAAAIAWALALAEDDDLVVIAGKGHETVQIVGERALPFSDAEEVRRWFGPSEGA